MHPGKRERERFQYPRLLDVGNQFGVGTVVRPYIIRLSVRRSSNFYVWVRERERNIVCVCVWESEREREREWERVSERAFIVKWCPSQTSERHWSPLNHVTPPPGLRKAAASAWRAVVAINVVVVKCMTPCTTATLLHYNLWKRRRVSLSHTLSLSLTRTQTHTHTLSLSLFR